MFGHLRKFVEWYPTLQNEAFETPTTVKIFWWAKLTAWWIGEILGKGVKIRFIRHTLKYCITPLAFLRFCALWAMKVIFAINARADTQKFQRARAALDAKEFWK